MKNVITIIIMTIIPMYVFPQWTELNVNQPNNVNSVKFNNNNVGFILGQNNSFKKTNDGGESWQSLICNIEIDVYDFVFIEDTIIIAAGYTYNPANYIYTGKIIKSIDNGQTWDSIFGISNVTFNSIYFKNSNIGYVLGKNCIYKTTDQGNNWVLANDSLINSLISNFYYAYMKSLTFLNDSIGIATAQIYGNGGLNGIILKTYNNGQNWSIVNQDQEIPGTIHTFNNDTLIYICSSTAVFKSFDKGETWEKYINSSGPNSINFTNSVYFINNLIGYSVNCEIYYVEEDPTGEVYIYNTTNGGLSWDLQYFDTYLHTGQDQYLFSVYFLNADTGFAVGKDRIIRITNASSFYTNTDSKIDSHNKLTIYPNPCNGKLNIKYNEIRSSSCIIKIADINGSVLKTYNIESNHINTIDLKGFSSGTYMISLVSKDEIIRRKIVLH